MGYTSKFTGAEIDNLLSKVQEGGSESGGGSKVYFFHAATQDEIVDDAFISSMEEYNTSLGGALDGMIELARGMKQENEEILERIKNEAITVRFDIGSIMIAMSKAMGYEPSQTGIVSLSLPTVVEYVAQGAELIQIISIPAKDNLVGYVANAIYIFQRIVQDGAASDKYFRLTQSEASYRVPRPDGTITDTAREQNLKAIDYEQFFDNHYVETPSYDILPVISSPIESSKYKSLYYIDEGKLLKATVQKDTGDAAVTIIQDFTT